MLFPADAFADFCHVCLACARAWCVRVCVRACVRACLRVVAWFERLLMCGVWVGGFHFVLLQQENRPVVFFFRSYSLLVSIDSFSSTVKLSQGVRRVLV